MRHRTLAGIILCLAVARVTAAPITYTETAIMNGTLDGVPFSFRQVTVTASTNTQSVVRGVCCFVASLSAATFSIEGVGSGTITDLVRVISNPDYGLAGFAAGGIPILETWSDALIGYDLSRPIGPISGFPSYARAVDGQSVPTSLGALTFTNSTNSTFTAVIPVPAAAWLLGSALGVLVWLRRRVPH
jgi:hypothetical protein